MNHFPNNLNYTRFIEYYILNTFNYTFRLTRTVSKLFFILTSRCLWIVFFFFSKNVNHCYEKGFVLF